MIRLPIQNRTFVPMQIDELAGGERLRPLKWSLRGTPHATIEVTRVCNIQCQACYNLDRGEHKTLVQVRAEIDLACRLRRLQAITLLGGEPSLHPELAAIVRTVKSKGILCQLLTNGIALMPHADHGLLDRLAAAGIDRILVHVDAGQRHVHPDLDVARRSVFDRLERRGIHFSLSVTVYNHSRGELPELVRRYARYRCFDGILAVLARDPLPPFVQDTHMRAEHLSVAAGLGLGPTGYLPSNLDDRDVGWLLYLYYVNARTGRTFGLSSGLDRMVRRLVRLATGRHLFVIRFPTGTFLPALIGAGLAEVLSNPSRLPDWLALLEGSQAGRELRFQYIVIQNPPEQDERHQKLRLCHHCPDATIRNGRLTAVCLADQVSPPQGARADRPADPELGRQVCEHLGQA